MVDEDILTSLKNAIERDEDLEEASQTLINAGYSAKEVNEAKSFLKKGVLSSETEKEQSGENFTQKPAMKIENKPSFFSKVGGLFSKKKKAEEKPEKIEEREEEFSNIETKEEAEETEDEELHEEISRMKSIKIPPPESLPSENNTALMIAIAILIILVILLSLAILFRNSIINWF